MIRIFKLVLLLVVSQVAFGQAPANYTNINGRYRWIAGMFDSTFHIPKGTNASLRTGGSTNAGALFYNTTDSSVYTYTGTQWIKLRGVVIDTTSLSNRINLKLNISDTASMLSPYARKNFLNAGTGISYSSTTGTIANTAPDQTVALNAGTGISISGTYPNFTITNSSPSSGGTVTSVGSNNGTGLTGGPITTSGTLAIDTLLVSTRAWRQKGIDSLQANLTAGLATKLNISDTASMLSPYARTNVVNAGLALKVNISDTASMLTPYLRKIDTTSMLSPYLRSNVAAATYVPQTRTITINGTSQDLTTDRTYNVGTVTSVGATAGTGISVSGSPITSSGSFTITNTAPDQTVALTAGTGISIAGTYPSFTITNSSPSSGGTVTSVGSGYGLSGGPITSSGTLLVDSATLSSYYLRRKDSLTATNLLGYVTGKILADTAAAIRAAAGGGSIGGSGTTNYIPKFTSSSAIGNSNLINDASGNLGLGVTPSAWTTFPAFQIGGLGLMGTSTDVNLSANGYYNGSWRYRNTGAVTLYNQSAGVHSWYYAASGSADAVASLTQAMTLDASGRLGLGTTTIGSRLQVNGNAAIGYSASTAAPTNGLAISGTFLVGTTDATNTDKARINNDGTNVYSTIRMTNANSTANMYVGVGGSAVANTALRNNAYVWNAAATALAFGTSDVEAMRITSGGASASVGIGTSTIGSKLQVNGNAAIGYSASTAAPTNGLAVSGNVAIGLTNPAFRLHVLATDGLMGGFATTSATGGYVGFRYNTSTTFGYIGSGNFLVTGGAVTDMAVTTDSGNILFATGSAAERGRFTSTGGFVLTTGANVSAIAQTGYSLTGSNAQSLIDLAGTWNTTGNPTAIKLNITNTASGATANLMDLQVGGTSEFKVTKAGYVGINQGTPTSMFHVQGSIAPAITTKTATYTLTGDDHTVIFNLNGNATANLPDATTCTGRIYVIKINRTNVADTLTIDPNGAQTIDGFASYGLQCQYAVTIQSDGSNWQIVGDFGAGLNCL